MTGRFHMSNLRRHISVAGKIATYSLLTVGAVSCSKVTDPNFAVSCSGKSQYGTAYNLTIISSGNLGEKAGVINGVSYYPREISVHNDDTGNWLTIRQFGALTFDPEGKPSKISIPSTISTLPRPGTQFSDSNEGLTAPLLIDRITGAFAVDLYEGPNNICEKIAYFEPPPAIKVAAEPQNDRKQKF